MKIFDVGPVSCLLQSGAECEDCNLELKAAAASMYCRPCRDNVTIVWNVALCMQTWHCYSPASSEMQHVSCAGMH